MCRCTYFWPKACLPVRDQVISLVNSISSSGSCMGPITHTVSGEKRVVTLNSSPVREATVGQPMECFMQLQLLGLFSEMNGKKNGNCLLDLFKGLYVYCRWANYTPWCSPICCFFVCLFQETKINCVRLATKGTWVFFFLQSAMLVMWKLQWWHNLITVTIQRTSLLFLFFFFF